MFGNFKKKGRTLWVPSGAGVILGILHWFWKFYPGSLPVPLLEVRSNLELLDESAVLRLER